MSQERAEALVLRGVDFSETSRIVTLVTAQRGRLVCMATGARRPKSPFAGMLDTYNRLEIVYYWKESREVQTLAEATLIDAYTDIKNHMEKSTYASFPLELTLRVAQANEPSAPLFHQAVTGFHQLDRWRGDVRAHCCWQVLGLLAAAGFQPSLERCCACGGSVPSAPSFSLDGGVTCRACPGDRRLTAKDYAQLRALAKAGDACPNIEATPGVFDALRDFAMRQLETDFKSVRVIRQVLS